MNTPPKSFLFWSGLAACLLCMASLFPFSSALAQDIVPTPVFQPAGSAAATGLLAAQAPRYSGLALGWAVMAVLVVALAYSLIALVRALNSDTAPPVPLWMDLLTPILALAGLGVALYLSYVETQSVQAICGPVGDCNAVQNSRYATLFGVLPVGILGAVGYIAILLAWLVGRLASGRLKNYAGPAIFTMALLGTIYSIYLTYLELLVIRAVCIWCLTSAVIIALILVLNVRPLLNSLNPAEDSL